MKIAASIVDDKKPAREMPPEKPFLRGISILSTASRSRIARFCAKGVCTTGAGSGLVPIFETNG
jgi:hypothetical protein